MSGLQIGDIIMQAEGSLLYSVDQLKNAVDYARRHREHQLNLIVRDHRSGSEYYMTMFVN
jgi:hypothetical protein